MEDREILQTAIRQDLSNLYLIPQEMIDELEIELEVFLKGGDTALREYFPRLRNDLEFARELILNHHYSGSFFSPKVRCQVFLMSKQKSARK